MRIFSNTDTKPTPYPKSIKPNLEVRITLQEMNVAPYVVLNCTSTHQADHKVMHGRTLDSTLTIQWLTFVHKFCAHVAEHELSHLQRIFEVRFEVSFVGSSFIRLQVGEVVN